MIPPGTARVVAEHGADGIVTSAPLQIAEGKTIDLTLVLSPAVVSGTVVDGQDAPIAGAGVSVDGVPWTIDATTDAAGMFRLTTVPEQATGLLAVARGYKRGFASIGGRADGVDVITRIVLRAGDPVTGEVRDDDGNPVSARVVACEGESSETKTQSAGDGSFQLPPTAIGCEAVAEHAELGASDPVAVTDGARLTLRLRPGSAVTGVVVDERGGPLTPFKVAIESCSPARGKDFNHGGPRAFDDARGAFRWDRLAPGTYVLTASAAGRPPARSGAIEVRSGQTTSGVRIVVAPGGAVEGTVADAAHRPIAAVGLRFDQVSRALDSESVASTDAHGHYRLEGAPSGLLTIRARKDGYVTRLVSGVHVDTGATVRHDIVLDALDGGPTTELAGIGAAIAQTPDGLALQTVFANDPAERAGLRAGDAIVAIDGEPTDGMSIADALQRIRGEPETAVGISVRRPGTNRVVDVTIVRSIVAQ